MPVIKRRQNSSVAAASDSSSRRAAGSNLVQELVVGTLSGVVSTVLAHPLDTIKTRCQIAGASQCTMTGVLTQTIRNEGAPALFRGVHAPIASGGFTCGITMFAKSLWTKALRKQFGYRQGESGSHSLVAAAGALTGITIAPIVIPADLVKIRMQGSCTKQTTLQCALNILRKDGVKALTLGSTAGVLQLASLWGVLFCGYEGLMNAMTGPDGKRPGGHAPILAGSVVGVVSWAVSIPMDIVKTRMQMHPEENPSFVKTVRTIYDRDGTKGYYRGFNAVAARALVSNAAFFWTYEVLTRVFSGNH